MFDRSQAIRFSCSSHRSKPERIILSGKSFCVHGATQYLLVSGIVIVDLTAFMTLDASLSFYKLTCNCCRRVLRHGRSLANEKGIIVSTYENGLPPNYGLHKPGCQQAVQAG